MAHVKNDDIRVSRPDDANIMDGNVDSEAATLTLLISKTDDLKLWLLRELQVRDEIWQADVLAERERKVSDVESEESLQSLRSKHSPGSPGSHYSSHRKKSAPAAVENNNSKLFPNFLWSCPKEMYDV
jgi:hypothetical protein